MSETEAKAALKHFEDAFFNHTIHTNIVGFTAELKLKDDEYGVNVYLENNTVDEMPTHFEGLRLRYEHTGRFIAE